MPFPKLTVNTALFCVLLVLIFFFSIDRIVKARAANSQEGLHRTIFRGIKIVALPPETGAYFDVALTGGTEGIIKLEATLDFIYQRSPYNAERIRFLLNGGNVLAIYDPNFPKERLHKGLFGLFNGRLPNIINNGKSGNGRKNYVMIVGRHGINWPVQELAGIIVHELVGHGTQHYRGQLGLLPQLDAECEAWLYHEKANQDFGVNKRSRYMVTFRRNLEFKYCVGFKSFMKDRLRDEYKLWDALNPGVPRLLELFEVYENSLFTPAD
ncbi:MAG TPA: hypothetical protein EYM99_03580 [Alphaproteobacteria bacterium]|nr:hypothetical protein [Alphaproteobacteria bacterium]